ncbi:hypothetical protein [Agrobacterium tumefaciens]|uniref:hypothetical protein n=1 Tax=Agrobacterium tumefaciens TaxID=358 RepID=UPI00104C235C|nr:hypothetical protein [Agrobacterium tumefaciens]TCV49276.1 hypothetical protein EDB97_111149 [Agrobacterium tumefaciens]
MSFDFEKFWRTGPAQNWPRSLILCLFTGCDIPQFSTPMARDPEPATGDMFNQKFLAFYWKAIEQNPAIHDGAVMIGRKTVHEPYEIVGWSYRLFPPGLGSAEIVNRGSAINSCVAMSTVATVDTAYKITDGHLIRFVGGNMTEIL